MPACIGSEKLISRAAESGFKFVDAELFEHLKSCEMCAAHLKGLKRLRSAFESAPRYPAPNLMTERVMQRIAAGDLRKSPAATPLRNLAAALALFFALGAGVLSGTFLASNIMGEAGTSARNSGSRNTLLAYSGDTLDTASPDSVAGDYLTVAEDANEK